MEKKAISKSVIWLALFGVYLGWGVIYLANHYILAVFPAFIINGIRNIVAGVILYAFLRLRGEAPPSARMWKSALFVGFIMICCGSGANFWAQTVVPTGMSSLLIGSTPLWLVIMEIFICKKNKTKGPGALAVLGVLIGFGGIILLIGPGNIFGANIELNPVGAAALLGGSLFFAAGSLKSRSAHLPPSRVLSSAMFMIGGGISCIVVGLIMGEGARLSFDNITLSSILGFMYTVSGGTLLAFVLFTWLMTAAPVTLVSTSAYVCPIVAIFLGVLILDEAFTTRHLIASIQILVAVALVGATSGKKT